jgi:drug/metabolite transporter (DMT)-like permease
LAGSALLILNGAIHPEQNYYYAILVLIASICYAVNVNLIKKHLHDLSPLSITTVILWCCLFQHLLSCFSLVF